MKILNNDFHLKQFLHRLQMSSKRVIMFDYDGTLAPFKQQRDQAYPYPEIIPLLNKLMESAKNRTIIISGRTIDSLKKLLSTKTLPELWGCHGMERLSLDGKYTVVKIDNKTKEKLSEIRRWIVDQHFDHITEKKPSGFAFHWRGFREDKAQEIRNKVIKKWLEEIKSSGLSFHDFDGGIEIKIDSINKGNAVSAILNENKEKCYFCYMGDDITDEDAFAKLKGHGLSVLVNSSPRETKADIWIKPPEELIEFLHYWL
ncbi:MAG: trehalose-phosphatase [FCB group bacterium]|nr:trehalose-phosphatase [FCB group bacterium]